MFDDLDLTKKIIEPDLYLCKPDRTILAKLNPSYNILHKMNLGSMSELEFNLPYYIDLQHELQRNPHVDLMRYRYQIKLEYKDKNYEEWFLIENPIDNMEDEIDYKNIKCFSLQIELNGKKIKNYIKKSVNATQFLTDALEDTEWTIDYINPNFNNTYRTIEISLKTALEFVNDIAKTFEAIPIFDTTNRTISLYDENDIGEDKGLYFSYGKYLKSMNKEINPNDFCTILKCYGQNDISINEVNPTGFDYIFDYSYFMYPFERDEFDSVLSSSYYMSDSLCHAILDYNELLVTKNGVEDIADVGTTETNITMTGHGLVNGDWILNKTRYNEYRQVTVVDVNNITVTTITGQTIGDEILKYKDGTFRKLLFQKEEKQNELTTLNNELDTLKNELIIILDNIAVGEENNEDVSVLIIQRDNKQTEINNKNIEIINKQTEINNIDTSIAIIRTELSLANNFTTNQLTELKRYNKEDIYENQNIINAQDLYDVSLEIFAKKNEPQSLINIDAVNFLQCIECQHDWNKLNLGDIIYVKNDILNVNYQSKITEIEFNFEDNNINLTISNNKDVLSAKDRSIKKLYDSIYTTNNLKKKQIDWDLNLTNFNSRNDRISTVPADPVVASDGTAIDHVINTDGSCDISFEWTYDGLGDSYNIDGFILYSRSSTSTESYVFGSTLAKEEVINLTPEKRGFLIRGVPANKYYTFGIQAYRIVDSDINANEILKSNIIKSANVDEDPYLPAVNIEFNGDVINTIGGVPYYQINKSPVTVIVADSSTSQNINRADYVVPADSTSAEDTINTAINSLPSAGGKVVLLDGTYIVDGHITISKNNVTIEGQGTGTVLYIKNSTNTTVFVLYGSGKNDISMKNLRIDGNRTNQTSGTQYGIYFYNSNNIIIDNCIINNLRLRGIYLNETNNSVISNNIIDNCYSNEGIYLNASNNNNITGNNCTSNRHGIQIDWASYNNNINNNICTDNWDCGILSTWGGKYNTIASNICNNNSRQGILLGLLGKNTVSSNVCKNNGSYGIALLFATDNVVSNNVCIDNGQNSINTDSNINLQDSDRNSIQSNVCRCSNIHSGTAQSGGANTIQLASGASGTNDYYNNMGIRITSETGIGQIRKITDYDGTTKTVTVDINWSINPDATSTYIILSPTKYGICVIDSGSVDNVVTNNDLLNSGASGDFSDAGTGTVTTAGNRTTF